MRNSLIISMKQPKEEEKILEHLAMTSSELYAAADLLLIENSVLDAAAIAQRFFPESKNILFFGMNTFRLFFAGKPGYGVPFSGPGFRPLEDLNRFMVIPHHTTANMWLKGSPTRLAFVRTVKSFIAKA